MKLSEEKKLEILEAIEGQEQINEEDKHNLLLLSEDEDKYVRCRVAELLVFFPISFSRKMLIKLSKDKDELTRVSACDSLCIFGDKKVIALLIDRLIHDESELVRSYAALSLGDIACEFRIAVSYIMSQLIFRLKRETSEHITTSIYRSLYLIDRREEYFNQLLKGLSSEHYYIRSSAVGFLGETCSNENKQIIIKALTTLLEKEETYAVTSKIESVLREITEN